MQLEVRLPENCVKIVSYWVREKRLHLLGRGSWAGRLWIISDVHFQSEPPRLRVSKYRSGSSLMSLSIWYRGIVGKSTCATVMLYTLCRYITLGMRTRDVSICPVVVDKRSSGMLAQGVTWTTCWSLRSRPKGPAWVCFMTCYNVQKLKSS